MVASELNQRLDYLISYSSQLVFVCSDKISSPTQVIEDFLTNQQEQADFALLTANELTPLVIYREKLFRQLISQHQIADFNRPLNQLLAGLNQQQGPIVISVFQAEKLPNQIVKELWDLVLQSRFAKNKQQLNILLVGLSTWAEQVKAKLASKSKEQPILLTSNSVEPYISNQEISELESLIQDNRKKFAQRIQARRETTYYTQPIFKKWWVNAVLGLLFLTIFAGMLSWQYPDKLQALINIVTQKVVVQPLPIAEPQLSSTKATITPDEIVEPSQQDNIIATDQTAASLATTQNELPTEQKPTNNELVTDWSTASAKLAQRTNKILANSKQEESDVINSEPIKTKIAIPEQAKITGGSEVIQIGKLPKPNLTDYAVEDVYIPAQAVKQPAQSMTGIKPAVKDNQLNLNNNIVAALPDSQFVIQVAAMANKSILQEYIKDEQLGGKLWIYKTQRYGADWYVLLNNQAFASMQEARAKIANLSSAVLRNTPFVKSVRQVKQEIPLSIPQS